MKKEKIRQKGRGKMRQIFLISLIIMSSASLCFAQMPMAVKPSVTPTNTVEAKSVSGKVESVVIADPVKGMKSRINIVGDSGNKTGLTVSATTKIYDSEMKAITLADIKKDQSVTVKYAIKGVVKEAISINLKK